MLPLLQLALAVLAIYSALRFPEEVKFLVPLGSLVCMFIVGRIDRARDEKVHARKAQLQIRMEEMLDKGGTSLKDQDFFTIDSLLWPKSEIVLIDAVHFIFRDLKVKIFAGVNYQFVDRILRVPGTPLAFGLQILMSERELGKNHPKVDRALQFEKEKREREKGLVIASTHTHLPLAGRERLTHITKPLADLLANHGVTFMTAHHLYQLWQKAKGGEIDIRKVLQRIYDHPGGTFPSKKMETLLSLNIPKQGPLVE